MAVPKYDEMYNDFLITLVDGKEHDIKEIREIVAKKKKLTDEDLFIAIPEILALNEMKPDFICLGALSRNVFYDILRSQITQPL